MTLRLIEQFERRARRHPDAPAIRQVATSDSPARLVTRGELAAWTAAVASRLAEAVAPGGTVLICAPNQPEFTAAFLAALAAGLRAFPVSPDLAEPELIAAAQRSSAAAVIGTDASLAVLAPHVPRRIGIDEVPGIIRNAPAAARAHDTGGLLLLSSGTTGRPKIVVRDARSLDAVSEAMAESIGFTESDHVLACVPLCHSYGIEHGLLAPTWAGSCVHLSRGFDLRVTLRELSGSGVSIFPGVPFMFEMLARHGGAPGGFPALRRAYSAGGPLPRTVADAFSAATGVTLAQLYGATEIGSVTFADPALPGFDPASVGRPMRGVAVRILPPDAPDAASRPPLPPGEHGHVAVAAASMLSGYLGESASPTVDGFFLTGDLGRLDAHGNLTITGRIKLLIDVGGLKVNPLEVEEVLAQHPGVASCVVVPVRVSETVSRLKAIVTPRPEFGAGPAAESLRRFARSRLTGYKVPRVFEVRADLPTSPTGKILRHLVEA
jgi:acyl-CoA synthetase (AMP-forming)/AMP-acid ligase II